MRDMSYLAQALRWWARQTFEGSIPPRHFGVLSECGAISFDDYHGMCDLTPKGKRMVNKYKIAEAVQ